MPQVAGPAIRERAARLRTAGTARLAAHLAAQQGVVHHILTEAPRMGRTEQFTEVSFATDQPEGRIVSARITGVAGQALAA
jgi:threonylcarbamoyladenosine tRNA methylthiotransferase MtaB